MFLYEIKANREFLMQHHERSQLRVKVFGFCLLGPSKSRPIIVCPTLMRYRQVFGMSVGPRRVDLKVMSLRLS